MAAPEWLSAIVALVALVLAFVSYNDQTKIKNLTDVVESLSGIVSELARQTTELSKQTQVLSDAHKLQDQLTISQRMPLFRFVNPLLVKPGNEIAHSFIFENIGLPAHDLEINVVNDPEDGGFDGKRAQVKRIAQQSKKAAPIYPRYFVIVDVYDPLTQFNMVFNWTDDNQTRYSQVIECSLHAMKLMPPIDMRGY